MFDITNLIYTIPKAISPNICQKFIDLFDENKEESYYESSLEANELKYKQASFLTHELPPGSEHFNYVREVTKKAVTEYQEYLASSGYFHKAYKHALRYSHKYRVLKYQKGAKIHAHIDHSPYIYASIVINLNEDYKGGEFSFFNGNYDINLKQGDIMIFPASHVWVHEVKPIIEGNRYSINSFLTALPLKVLKEINDIAEQKEQEYLKNTPSSEILGLYDH